MTVISTRFTLQKSPRGYRILAITAGTGNGWRFGAATLRASLHRWDHTHVFLDHSLNGRSVRDLAGILTNPQWDDNAQGIAADLIPFGPAKDTLHTLADDILAQPDLARNIGLSADIDITADGRTVTQIVTVHSVDIVINPARGGQILRAINHKERTMPTDTDTATTPDQSAEGQNDMTERIRALQQAQEQIAQENELRAKQEAVLRQMLQTLLDSTLAAAGLPEPSAQAIRQRFDGQIFEPADLTAAIDAKRQEIAAITASLSIQGPGRLAVTTGGEQFAAAVYDLLNAPRPDHLKNITPARLSGIREMYTLATGDINFWGTYDPDHARIQLATTASLPNLLADATNRIVRDHWQQLAAAGYEWWRKIVDVVQVSSMHDLKGVILSQIDVLPVVAEGADYQTISITDNQETAQFVKRGGYLGITLEMFLRDETRKLAAMPRMLAAAAIRTLSAAVADVFTQNSGAGPLMSDGNNLFSAAHNNLAADALSLTAWQTAQAAVFNQPMLAPAGANGGKLAVDAKYLLVPRALKNTALDIIVPRDTTQHPIGEPDDVVVVPEWTDPNDWAAVADPRVVPAITIGHLYGLTPEIYVAGNPNDYSVFMADESRIKVRHISAVLVSDYRPLHKSNVI